MASTSRPSRPLSTPKPPALKKSSSGSQSSKSQKSITGFFQKRPSGSPQANARLPSRDLHSTTASNRKEQSVSLKNASSSSLTPAPSSDSLEDLETIATLETMAMEDELDELINGLPSPITPVSGTASGDGLGSSLMKPLAFSSPSRKASQSLSTRK